tara:strand:- start:1458 stop:2036 length:579 start_codon:yes stop_codon:yes gene_type:complete
MSISLYKPNSKNTGAAFSFQAGLDNKTQELVLYIKAVKQHSWDAKKKQGYFHQNAKDPEKNIILKFNEFEIGSFIAAIDNRVEYSTFHAFGTDKTSIKFLPWDKPLKTTAFDNKTQQYAAKTITIPAFGLTLTKNGNNSFKTSLEPGEAHCFKAYLKQILSLLYTARIEKQIDNIRTGQALKRNEKEENFIS